MYFIKNGKLDRKELGKFYFESSDSDFLFGREIKSYVSEIDKKGLRSIHLGEQLEDMDLEIGKRKELSQELYEIESWFGEQHDHAKELFRKYLHFSIDKDL